MAGCGSSSSRTQSERELALERAQFVRVSGGLRSVTGAIRRELEASRAVWPSIAAGLPPVLPSTFKATVAAASASARTIPEPSFMKNAARLTGPAAGIAGLYEDYMRLAERGWLLTETTINAITSGPPATASFARENSSLYIDAIYDGHFDLSLVGKSILKAYEQLGGSRAFGLRLTQNEVNTLAAAYSIPSVRLEPHPAGTTKGG